MDFSVIIASRNRPVLVRAAIRSVLEQTHVSLEIILVNDGSDNEHAAAYAAIKQDCAGHGSFIDLRPTRLGHGQSYAYNRGAEIAQGKYLCFLDDDDCWTDSEHLSRALKALSAPGRNAEVYLSNQKAYLADVQINRHIWLEGLEQQLKDCRRTMDEGVYRVSIEDLMRCGNHAQVNTLILSRALYQRIGGLDESIRYECDVDFYLRVIDKADGILYSPHFVSRHNVPDPAKGLNMSTSVSALAKSLSRANVWNKAFLFSESASIRKKASGAKGYALRNVAILLLDEGRAAQAFRIGLEALGTYFSVKWLAFCGYLAIRAAIVRERSARSPTAARHGRLD
jgi:glycosyltransferase involved in cell wall biosynthesis